MKIESGVIYQTSGNYYKLFVKDGSALSFEFDDNFVNDININKFDMKSFAEIEKSQIVYKQTKNIFTKEQRRIIFSALFKSY